MKGLKIILSFIFLWCISSAYGQETTIRGVVKDISGEPLLGVTVVVKGTSLGTISDFDGNFTIDAASKSTLVFTYVGYKKLEVAVDGQKNIEVTLHEDNELLDELVVVGYGTQRRIDITGSIASISQEEIKSTTTSNLANALQGRVPGLNIKQDSGEPGDFANNIQIRGFGSPLVIVDGIPRGDFNRIDPNEIESVTVLKDASATVYGVQAANGVILVTTRRGSSKETEIKLSTSYGFQQVTKYPKASNAYQYMELYNEASANRGDLSPTYDPSLIASGSPYANINWYDEIVRNSAPQYQLNLTVTGGSEKITYFNSIGYYEEEGLWKSKSLNYKRYNIRSNITSKIINNLISEFNIGGYLDNKESPAYDSPDIFKAIGANLPIYEIYANGNSDYLGVQYNNDENPLVKSSNGYGGYRKQKNVQLQFSTSLQWNLPFVKGLSLKGLIAYDPKFHSAKLFKKQFKTYSYDTTTDKYSLATTSAMSRIEEWRNESDALTSQISANYETKINAEHNLKTLLLFETRKWTNADLSGGRNTVMDIIEEIHGGLVDDARSVNGGSGHNARVGLVGRVDYDYLSKYLVQVSFRYDGSSMFRNKQWGFFPAISLGWRVSEEPFIKNTFDFVDNLKIRGSVGKMGDDATSALYAWLYAYTYPGVDKYVLGEQGLIPGVGIPGIPNPSITWYTSTIKNIGFEVNLWNSMLSVEFDYFRRDRDDLLATPQSYAPGTFGSPFAQENLNSDMQQGFELALGHNNRIGDFQINLQGNITYTLGRDKHIDRIASGNSYDNWRHNSNNRNKGINWMYNSIGQYMNMEDIYNYPALGGVYYRNPGYLPGDIINEDYNEDGMIDEWDLQPLKRTDIALMNYGLSLGLSWKGFDMSMMFQGASMFDAKMTATPLKWGGNSWKMFSDRWHKVDADGNSAPFDPDGTWVAGKYPTIRIDDPQNYGTNSSFWYKNCTYLRLKNMEIGYTLPKNVTSYLGINALRIYANGYNLLTFQGKDMDYIDPETTEIGRYPIMRNFNFGANITF